jgi:hypothetical protein
LANVRSAIGVTIAPAALVAAAIALLLALHLIADLGFQGDPHAVVRDAAPGSRLFDVAARRAPVIGVTLLAWLAAFALAMTAARRWAGRAAARLLALSLVYLPLLCLLGAALEPPPGAERLLLMLGSPALGALTLVALGGYRALAAACAATAIAHALDLIGGSALIQLSLVGPNPAARHRFYGVGNELEACLVVLILVGTGAALSAPVRFSHRMSGEGAPEGSGVARYGPAVFLVVAAVFSFVFAYGRYGADVGAAITLPLGAAVAAALLAGRRRLALCAFLLPLPALAILSLADLLTGANAHLTRTVLDAKSGGDLLAVFGHRLSETVSSFARPVLLAGLPIAIAAATLVWVQRARVAAWLAGLPALRAALLGGLAATLVGTLANDSGALLLEIGGVYLLAFIGFAWAERPPVRAEPASRSTRLSSSCVSP